MEIELIPLTHRAKNRVREHGNTFRVIKTERVQCHNGKMSHLLESSKDGWRGWFACDEEVFREVV